MNPIHLWYKFYAMLFAIFILITSALMQPSSNPVELGDVQWIRSLDAAQKESAHSGKPILILFQEIPGCATCRNYGSQVLTNPLIVEAIETQFVPLAIHNNKKGADAEVLNLFSEPSWNNPVVRIVNEDLSAVSSRLNGDYTQAGLVNYMTSALIKAEGKAPGWLKLLNDELNTSEENRKTAVYSMYCFWSGEAHFGRVNGVLATEAGFANGKEVVKVTYNPSLISKSSLDKLAESGSCAFESKVNGYRPDATPQYYLANSKYAKVGMTALQKSRVNSALKEGQDPSEFLSPRQLEGVK